MVYDTVSHEQVQPVAGAGRLARAGAAVVASVTVLAGCASGGPESRATTTSPPAVEALVTDTIPIAGALWGVAVDAGAVWVSDASAAAVLEIDADSGDVIDSLPTGAADPRDTGLDADAGQVWVANLGGSVAVIDVATRRILARRAITGGEPAAVALDARWAWVPTHGPGGGLVRVDRADPGRDPLAIPLAESGFAVATAAGTVWVAGLDGRVFAVDAGSGRVERTVDVGGSPRGVAVAAGDVWVTLRDERTVVRLDGATGRVTARIATGGRPWPIAAGRDLVWTATLEGEVLRIDPATDTVTGRAPVAPDGRAIAVSDAAVWVTSTRGVLTRVHTTA